MANNLRANVSKLVALEKARKRQFKPILVTDIDGVLVRGGNPIPQTLEALRMIQKQNIPFACLTNGGGQLQAKKAHKLDIIFGEKLFKEDSMFMNHTPLKPKLKEYSQRSGNLLITGSLNVKEIVESLNISNYITADQFYSIYMLREGDNRSHDYFFDYVLHRRDINQEQIREEVEYRFGRKLGTFKQEAELINSFFALNDVSPYEVALRVMHNILLVKSAMTPAAQMQYYAAQNDITWASSYARPRMAFGPFNYILENHCKKHNFKLLEHIHYGKPQKRAFEFVGQQMLKREPEGVFFMVGDNPRADIKGANNVGWYSFLTQTGIHTKETNDLQNPATFVVTNFHQAVSTILEAAKQLR